MASDTAAAASRVPRVLAFVVVDDPLEPVVGVEVAGAHHARLVRLDPDAEEDHRVDRGMAGDELEHLGDGVAGLGAREVDRVVAAPPRREDLVDRGAQVVGERQEGRASDRPIASAVARPSRRRW